MLPALHKYWQHKQVSCPVSSSILDRITAEAGVCGRDCRRGTGSQANKGRDSRRNLARYQVGKVVIFAVTAAQW